MMTQSEKRMNPLADPFIIIDLGKTIFAAPNMYTCRKGFHAIRATLLGRIAHAEAPVQDRIMHQADDWTSKELISC